MKPPATLQIDQDLAFQKVQWRMSRIVWILLLAMMLAAALGVFGRGALSRTRAGDVGAPLWVEYDRVVRFGAPCRIVAHAGRQPDGFVRLTIDRSLLEGFRVQHVTPAPYATAFVDGGVEYRFQSTAGSAAVVFDLEPVAVDRARAHSVGGDRRRAGAVHPALSA